MAASIAHEINQPLAGIVLNGLATGLYIGAGFGPGPRDGLTTARTFTRERRCTLKDKFRIV